MKRYESKRAVIIGGTSGMGLVTAKMLLDECARVLVTGRSQAGLESAQRELGAHAIVVSSDARSLTDIDALAARVKTEFDTVDLLFVNAGFSIPTPLANVTEAIYDEMFNLNAKGPFFAVQKFAPLINRGGAVVLTTSIANVKGMPGQVTYGAAKAALRSFARTLAVELLPLEIRVNAVTPGPIDTGILEKAIPDKDAARQDEGTCERHGPHEALREVGGSRQGRPLPRVRRDLHDRRRTARGWRLVTALNSTRRWRRDNRTTAFGGPLMTHTTNHAVPEQGKLRRALGAVWAFVQAMESTGFDHTPCRLERLEREVRGLKEELRRSQNPTAVDANNREGSKCLY